MQDQDRAAKTNIENIKRRWICMCLARIELLTNRIRAQDWYRELSDQESEDEIDRMVGDEPRSAQEHGGI